MFNFEPLKGGENWPLFSANLGQLPLIEFQVSFLTFQMIILYIFHYKFGLFTSWSKMFDFHPSFFSFFFFH